MRCLSSSWLDPHQTQLPFTLSGKSSKNAATLPFHCLVHVEQKYGVSQKKSTSHVQKILPWEMLRKRWRFCLSICRSAQLQSDIHCIICRKPAKSTPSSSANSSSGGSSSCDIEPGWQAEKTCVLKVWGVFFFGSTKMISVYIYRKWGYQSYSVWKNVSTSIYIYIEMVSSKYSWNIKGRLHWFNDPASTSIRVFSSENSRIFLRSLRFAISVEPWFLHFSTFWVMPKKWCWIA